MKGKKVKILTSWDDGGQLDLKLGDMLFKYRIPAVFYIPSRFTALHPNQIKAIAGEKEGCSSCAQRKELFDIGAHTLTHPEDLKTLSQTKLELEIKKSKKELEKLVGREVTRFAYPSGRYNERVKKVVKDAGFKMARTVKPLNIEFPKDPFETHPTIHVHPHKEHYKGKTWVEWADKLFNKVLEEGGRFEIWGHSFELEKYNMWEFLEDFLAYMDDRLEEENYPRNINGYKEIK